MTIANRIVTNSTLTAGAPLNFWFCFLSLRPDTVKDERARDGE